MKKYLLTIISVCLFSTTNTKAQINLQFTFDSTYAGDLFYCTDIGNNDFKYVFLNKYSNGFSLYNMDMTPYLINVPIPSTGDSISQGFSVTYITKSLFDCDTSNIEYCFQFQYDLTKPYRVYRTDGTLLLKVDSANGPYGFGIYDGSLDWRPIKQTSDGAKLFLQKHDANNIPEILVYALCGNLPTTTYDFSQKKTFVRIFPNPTALELNFEIISPNTQEECQLVIFDANGIEQSRENLGVSQSRYSMDIKNYSSGTYLYSLISKNKVYQSGKFIITK